jgi:hypothetical protein
MTATAMREHIAAVGVARPRDEENPCRRIIMLLQA